MSSTTANQTLKFLLQDLIGDFFAFPLWWYSKGTLKVIQFILASTSRYAYTLSLRIWVKNLFVPMYNQYDIAGRIISFVLRIVVLIYRFILFVIWFLILMAFFALWLFGPLLVFWYILYQLFGVTFV